MKRLARYLTGLLLGSCIAAAVAGEHHEKQYLVPVYTGSKAADINPKKHRFRTMLRQALRDGPNFAGHYALALYGCGQGCVQGAIVDVKTGKVIDTPYLAGVHMFSANYKWYDSNITYAPDSTLLIIQGDINAIGTGVYRLQMKNGKLVLLKKDHEYTDE